MRQKHIGFKRRTKQSVSRDVVFKEDQAGGAVASTTSEELEIDLAALFNMPVTLVGVLHAPIPTIGASNLAPPVEAFNHDLEELSTSLPTLTNEESNLGGELGSSAPLKVYQRRSKYTIQN